MYVLPIHPLAGTGSSVLLFRSSQSDPFYNWIRSPVKKNDTSIYADILSFLFTEEAHEIIGSATVDIRDWEGRSPAFVASRLDVFEVLLNNGAEFNALYNGKSLLVFHAEKGASPIVRRLLSQPGIILPDVKLGKAFQNVVECSYLLQTPEAFDALLRKCRWNNAIALAHLVQKEIRSQNTPEFLEWSMDCFLAASRRSMELVNQSFARVPTSRFIWEAFSYKSTDRRFLEALEMLIQSNLMISWAGGTLLSSAIRYRRLEFIPIILRYEIVPANMHGIDDSPRSDFIRTWPPSATAVARQDMTCFAAWLVALQELV